MAKALTPTFDSKEKKSSGLYYMVKIDKGVCVSAESLTEVKAAENRKKQCWILCETTDDYERHCANMEKREGDNPGRKR